ncbi:MAG: sulfatase-like hydrolase/transferase [Myxococcota bacterium]
MGVAVQASTKRKVLFTLKLAVSLGILALIFRKVFEQDNIGDLWARVADLSWGWIGLAAASLFVAILCGVRRWQLLLGGQGIDAPFRHLFGSWMIGRFFGAVTPGGLGLNGYRLYDIATRTGKTARATAVTGIEMILGWLAFGAVVIAGSFFGLRYLQLGGVLAVDAFFAAFMIAAIVLLSRPGIFRWLAERLPPGVRTRIRTLVDAVCAYQGRTLLLSKAALLGAGIHIFNNFIYVCTARALGVELSAGEVFFVSSLQIFATLMPISIGGVGLREAAAVGLYTIVGVPAGLAVLIPLVGIAVEYSISALGGFVLVARRQSYAPDIAVEDADREEAAHAEIPTVPEERWPRVSRGASLGLGAGALAGAAVGIAEGAVVLASSNAAPSYGALAYGAVAYGLLCAGGGTALGALLAWSGRWLQRAAVEEPRAYGHLAALMVSVPAFALGAFRIRRDVFHEQLAWKSPEGLGVLAACLAAAAILYAVLALGLRVATARRAGRWLLRPWGTPLAVAGAVVVLTAVDLLGGAAAEGKDRVERPAAPALAGDVLVLVVDTLRADALPSYGYEAGETPHLDAFAKDAVRFDQAFANSSWTRPSFATILTGRFASSHKVMGKLDPLPDALDTMPEAFRDAGYHTAGFVTNYNVAPYFNFQQGFDDYAYLEPEYVLGADDTASKLLFVQALRRVVEKARGAQPGLAYQDAETVNGSVLEWLDGEPSSPFFLFVGYMDPHDPYFEHPYAGEGFSRAAHQSPDPALAPKLRALYDGEVTYWDAHFGKLVRALKERGLYDDLTIVVTSDHGEEFMEHGGFWHGTTLYDEQIRVPMFLKLPGNRQGGTVASQWVQLVDLMPTLLELNGIEIPDGVQGGDMFEGSADVYAEESHEGNVLESLRTRLDGRELKLITANAGNPRGLPAEELFDVARDPGEARNLWAEDADGELVDKRLSYWSEQAEEGAVERPDSDVELDDAAAARLRSLGYVE